MGADYVPMMHIGFFRDGNVTRNRDKALSVVVINSFLILPVDIKYL